MEVTMKRQIFSLANKLVKELKCSRKEAFAEAKRRLSSNVEFKISKEELENALLSRRVKIEFINSRGGKSITTATKKEELITKSYKIKGRSVTRSAEEVVFFDVRHGMWRTVKVSNVLEMK